MTEKENVENFIKNIQEARKRVEDRKQGKEKENEIEDNAMTEETKQTYPDKLSE